MEQLKHECGVAMIRLLKPLAYYKEKYGTLAYGFNKLYLMMEKQHNRGQEGAGFACVNMDAPVGTEYMFRERAEGKDAITEIFKRIDNGKWKIEDYHAAKDDAQPNFQFSILNSQLFMGHLRYSTTGKSGLTYVHPFLRRNNWRAKNLCLCGNFNMTNIDEVFRFLTAQGQSPRIYGDAYIMLELMGHRLDREAERLFEEAKAKGLEGLDITRYIDDHVEMANVLRTTMTHFDGGYVMCGLTGSGEMFAVRDPWGIRPAFYYRDDEMVAVASERPVLQTTFDLQYEDIHELKPGEALIVRRNGDFKLEQIIVGNGSDRCSNAPAVTVVGNGSDRCSNAPAATVVGNGSDRCSNASAATVGAVAHYPYAACSFERIYFSRGSDRDIYQERKRLGEQLTPAILRAIGGDVENTVFSYIPNTAEVAFYGMTDGFRRQGYNVRTEKVVWKDIKLRTFITDNSERNDLAAHVYDISYGSLRPCEDNLVIIDDSIVRGTTLRESIFKILDRLHPKKIVMVSSSPQIRYPDYYGIDMSRLEELCAFRAAIALIQERGMEHLIDEIYREASSWKALSTPVRRIYEPFTVEEINRKIVEILRPADMQTPVELVFQSIEGLHKAIPHHPGDWYFTGHYPTPGGIRMVNQAFINYVLNFRKLSKELLSKELLSKELWSKELWR